MSHEQLVERAKAAIEAVFSDQSVDVQTKRESLNELLEGVQIRLEVLVYFQAT